jgi:uncharacterized protein YceK
MASKLLAVLLIACMSGCYSTAKHDQNRDLPATYTHCHFIESGDGGYELVCTQTWCALTAK